MKKWRCTVCGYIHEGPTPPDTCPICGVGPEEFEEIKEEAVQEKGESIPTGDTKELGAVAGGNAREAIFKISYGLYVITSKKDDKFNGQMANTVFQITSEPQRVALGINKNNLTHEFIQSSGVATINILGKGNFAHIKRFGYQTGHKVDKMAGLAYALSPVNGCPVLTDSSAFLDLKIIPEMSVDVGTHTLFVADVVDGNMIKDSEPITYSFYRANRAKAPERLEGDVQNVINTLNLEYGATQRYQYQIRQINNPSINAALEGIMRTEGDHVEQALAYLREKFPGKGTGFDQTLLHLQLNLEFEEVAAALYRQFAKEAEREDLRQSFLSMAQSETGHVNIFRQMIEAMEKGEYPVLFYCPLCGWELDYGRGPQEGEVRRCGRCGKSYALKMVDGEWTLIES
ncbi:MAG: hypothetical protein GX779_08110 [Clostridia bacterium]|nr:hypothetical protein [Clostridia bacterium]